MRFQLKILVSAMFGLPMAVQAADCPNGVFYNLSDSCQVPAGVISVTVHALGGGGGAADNAPFLGSAGGGGGGSYCGGTFAVTPGETLTWAIGTGGAGATGGVTGPYLGGAGGPTTVSSPSITGVTANGGSGGGVGINVLTGGAGGTTSGCTAPGATSYTGGNGGSGRATFSVAANDGGGGGGGAANSSGGGGNGVNGTGSGGAGGTAGAGVLFSGVGGAGGNPNQSGNPSPGFSGGGGGGAGEDNLADAFFTNGGNGLEGAVMFSYVLPHDISTLVNIPGCATSLNCDPNPVPNGQNSTCTVDPADGYEVLTWTGCDYFLGNICDLYNVTEPRTVTANCTLLPTYPITEQVNIPGCATVSCNPDPVIEGEDSACTATPAPGYQITSWTGCTSFSGNDCDLIGVTEPKTVTANCTPLYDITVTVGPEERCAAVTCDPNPVLQGDNSTCTAIPQPGYQVSWGPGCDESPTNPNQCSVPNAQGNVALDVTCSLIKPVPVLPFWGLGLLGGLLAGMVGFGRRLIRK